MAECKVQLPTKDILHENSKTIKYILPVQFAYVFKDKKNCAGAGGETGP
jgi:hypothetical protein